MNRTAELPTRVHHNACGFSCGTVRGCDPPEFRGGLGHSPEGNREGKAGATVRFGVAWYDEAFFREKPDNYLGSEHLAMFAGFGAGSADVGVKHYVLAA